jgi:hypothetical protein
MGTFTRYSEDEWAAILAACDWPPSANLEQVRHDLEEAGQFFWLTHNRRLRMSPKRALRRLNRARGPLPPRLDAWRAYYEALSSDLFRGKRDFHRETLYWRVLQIWSDLTGKPLAFSRPSSRRGAPRGPLVRFLMAALRPILTNDMPRAETLAKIVQRERAVREAIKRRKPNCRSAPRRAS